MAEAFKSLTELQLNGTLMTWLEMQAVITNMPQLRLIEMGYNKLADLPTLDSCLPDNNGALQVINLDGNACHDWVHLCKALHQYVSYVFFLDIEISSFNFYQDWSVSF